MKRIMYGNLILGYEVNKDKSAHFEILDVKSQAKFFVNIDKTGTSRYAWTLPNGKLKKKIPIVKPLKRLYDMYNKEVA